MGHPPKSHKTDKRPTPHVPGDPGEIDPAQLLRPSIRRPATGFVGSCWLPGAAPHFSRTADGQTALGSPPASPPQHVEEIAASQRRPPAEEPCLQEEQALIWRVVFQHAHFDDDEDIEALCGALRLSLRNGVNIPQPGRGGPTVDIRLGSLLLETVACTL